ncbi:Ankyrin repeat domain-containing protein 2 [Hondaea fermentalgiana]|uniref:Ankyrin repeat domain-containing protein 2 n=1 Tax=Hondaea fermentalgiana TaxID=2315210 RepID=A0A2R5GJ08_9STRA|nr:Ankyrin repeat domain-containing protein 2 [Hondaea fermentalgiana]|eukprot:GBG30870.1 Ankyrin repeat domain-containing protein 2 [Hondaea fermentalgiana]
MDDLNGNTPLHFAVEAGSLEVVEFFLEHKLPFDMSNAGGVTPLLIACRDNLRKIAFILASAGADICKANTTGNSPLQVAAKQGWGEDLRRAGAVPEQPEPPEMLRMDDESAMFSWTAPAGRSAPVQHFRLQAKRIDRLNPDAPWETVADCIKERRHTFYTCTAHCSTYSRDPRPEDLAPSEVYAVRVLAYSIVGWSEPSEQSRMFVTSPAAPSRPEPPSILRTTRTSLTVRWELPEANGAPIDRSELQWRLAHTPYVTWSSVPDKLEVERPACSDEEPSSSESDTDEEEDPLKRIQVQEYTVKGLSREAGYVFRVRCHNLMGWSYYSVPSIKACTSSRDPRARRHGLGAHQTDSVRRSFRGTASHAQARFMAISLAREDDDHKSKLTAEIIAHQDLERRQKAAVLKLQTFWRGRRAAWKYHNYLRDRVVRKSFLVEYSLEQSFIEEWRLHLMRFVIEAHDLEARKQKELDARRQRKMARALRREKRQLTRKIRADRRKQQSGEMSKNLA